MVLQKIKEFYQINKKFLIENYPGLSEKRLVEEFHSDTSEQLNQHFSKLSLGIPLEYITGKSFFYNSEFLVNEYTLIPRFETEGLVEMATGLVIENDKVLDIGTGSGNIIISLLQELPFSVKAKAIDISEECLKIARMNAFRLRYKYHPASTLVFAKQDRLKGEDQQYNLIISNPPYIKKDADRKLVHHQVLKYEPHLALFLDDEKYTAWFIEFFEQISNHLEKKGIFLMEGHENHLVELKIIAEKYFFNVEIRKDLAGKERYLFAQKG